MDQLEQDLVKSALQVTNKYLKATKMDQLDQDLLKGALEVIGKYFQEDDVLRIVDGEAIIIKISGDKK